MHSCNVSYLKLAKPGARNSKFTNTCESASHKKKCVFTESNMSLDLQHRPCLAHESNHALHPFFFHRCYQFSREKNGKIPYATRVLLCHDQTRQQHASAPTPSTTPSSLLKPRRRYFCTPPKKKQPNKTKKLLKPLSLH